MHLRKSRKELPAATGCCYGSSDEKKPVNPGGTRKHPEVRGGERGTQKYLELYEKIRPISGGKGEGARERWVQLAREEQEKEGGVNARSGAATCTNGSAATRTANAKEKGEGQTILIQRLPGKRKKKRKLSILLGGEVALGAPPVRPWEGRKKIGRGKSRKTGEKKKEENH